MADSKTENIKVVGVGGGDLDSSAATGIDASSSAIATSPEQYVTLEPSAAGDGIQFRISKGVPARSSIRITNTSNQSVAFKVKTTFPTWYIVKPNQDILEPHKYADVSIQVSDSQRDALIADRTDKSSDRKNKFLIQTRILTDAEAIAIHNASASSKRGEEFSRLFQERSEEQKVRVKFNFDYSNNYNKNIPSPAIAIATPIATDSSYNNNGNINGNNSNNNNSNSNSYHNNNNNNNNNSDSQERGQGVVGSPLRSPMLFGRGGDSEGKSSVADGNDSASAPSSEAAGAPGSQHHRSSSQQSRRPSASTSTNLNNNALHEKDVISGVGSSEKETLQKELEALKKRFDAIVEYTVHLATEREVMVGKYEELLKELNKEVNKVKKNNNNNNASDASSTVGSKVATQDKVQSGHTLFHVFLVGLLGFLLGRYFFR